MDDKIFGMISTTVGLLAGWILTEASGLVRIAKDNRKTYRQLLYAQLEIRDLIMKSDITSFQKILTPAVLEIIPEKDREPVSDLIMPLIYNHFQSQAKASFSSKLEKLVSNYDTKLTLLSEVDPYTTFSLSNKGNFFGYLDLVDGYVKGIKDELLRTIDLKAENVESEPEVQEAFIKMANSLTPAMHKDAIETIEVDIIRISEKIGWINRLKTKKFLKRTSFESGGYLTSKEFEIEFKESLNKLGLTPIIETMTNNQFHEKC